MKNKTAYTYSDVLIKPKYSEIETRSKVDISTNIGNLNLKLPVISSNMKTITGAKMAAKIAAFGGLGLLHRFCTIDENVKMYEEAVQLYNFDLPMFIKKTPNIGASIGVKDEDKERFYKLYGSGVRIFCIDVAHGHHLHVKNTLNWIIKELDSEINDVTLIAGNIATAEAYNDLTQWGAHAVKVGIGPSPVCRTRYNTGVGVPQLHALEEIYEESTKHSNPVDIIADGGITHVGDISKALKFADAVMVGSLIAGTSETPGHVFRNEAGELYKVYGGSASGENKGENRFVEGVIKTVKFNGKVKYIFREIEQGLQSAFSYAGANNHKEFQQKCEFVEISNGSRYESKI